ncbi:enoyl-CoA hydratase-related protein [Ferrimonas gelatinilytica]|uniref:Enoyl-CoA hydratase-related protein n=1 Tax=Ferrimonas gelatinilytica TaxID=1255257 RepID=A0ABP9SCM7_9GAMM
MTYQFIKLQCQGPVARLTLARPDKHNAFNAEMIAEITGALVTLGDRSDLSLLILDAEGKHFCAGADLAWMQSQARMSEAENRADALQLATLFDTLFHFPTPVLALVQGAAFGGALGLVACADIVLADARARFCLSEVKLGLIPATIGPYVARAIGQRQLRRYALSAEVIDADSALALGLVHQLCGDLEVAAEAMVTQLRHNGPDALRACKDLLLHLDDAPLDTALKQETAHRIATVRSSAEGQAGLAAFFAKRPAPWCPDDNHKDVS